MGGTGWGGGDEHVTHRAPQGTKSETQPSWGTLGRPALCCALVWPVGSSGPQSPAGDREPRAQVVRSTVWSVQSPELPEGLRER